MEDCPFFHVLPRTAYTNILVIHIPPELWYNYCNSGGIYLCVTPEQLRTTRHI